MKKLHASMDLPCPDAEREFFSVVRKSRFFKSRGLFFSALTLAFWGLMMPVDLLGAPVTIGFPHTTQQIGGNGEKGVGGTGGSGGDGGYGGGYSGMLFQYSPLPGSNGEGGEKGGSGKKGGTGGSGTWILQNMPSGNAVSNQGMVFVGGSTGDMGETGKLGAAGGDGGLGGMLFAVPFDHGWWGEEPNPDPDPNTFQGGDGGATFKNGEDGVDGGGGGGGGDGGAPNIFFPLILGGHGGDGGKGLNGQPGNGKSGLPGVLESAVTATNFLNTTSVQIGGTGGQGGQGGQGGTGGGGGGGAGNVTNVILVVPIPTYPEEGGKGGAPGARGVGGPRGNGGEGTIDIRHAGSFINERGGKLVIGRGADGGSGALKIRIGASLTNRDQVDINKNGTLEVLGGTVDNQRDILNSGIIENNGTFINNGRVESIVGTFANFGSFLGAGTYVGDFNNNGVVAPGNSIGTMTIDGSFFNWGTLEFEIGGFETGLHDFLDITGTASFSEYSMISFLSWNDYDFSDILPQQSKSLEFLYAEKGILDFYSAIAFGDASLPPGFGYDVYDDGYSLFLEVSNNVPIPSAIWLLGSGIVFLVGIRRKLKK